MSWLKKTSSRAHLHGSGAECIHTFGKLRAIAVTAEALQHLLGEMHKMQSEGLANLMKQQNDALAVLVGSGRENSELTDTRGIGRPVALKGDELKYAEWKAKLMAYLRISTPQSDELIKWVARADSTVTAEDVDISYPNNKQDVWRFAHKVYSILLSCTEDDAVRICHSVKEGNGLEAMRLLMKRYEPRTPGTKRGDRGYGWRRLARGFEGHGDHRFVHQGPQGTLGAEHP